MGGPICLKENQPQPPTPKPKTHPRGTPVSQCVRCDGAAPPGRRTLPSPTDDLLAVPEGVAGRVAGRRSCRGQAITVRRPRRCCGECAACRQGVCRAEGEGEGTGRMLGRSGSDQRAGRTAVEVAARHPRLVSLPTAVGRNLSAEAVISPAWLAGHESPARRERAARACRPLLHHGRRQGEVQRRPRRESQPSQIRTPPLLLPEGSRSWAKTRLRRPPCYWVAPLLTSAFRPHGRWQKEGQGSPP